MLQLALYHTSGLFDDFIRMDEANQYTHAAFLVDGQRFLECYPGKGVQWRDLRAEDGPHFDLFNLDGMTPEMEAATLSAAVSQLGKPYDWPGIIDFLMDRSDDTEATFFCSKYCFWALLMGGFALLARIRMGRVRPAELSYSTLLLAAAKPDLSSL